MWMSQLRWKAGPVLGAGCARHDVRRAFVSATFKILQRDAKLNVLKSEWLDLVEGNRTPAEHGSASAGAAR